MGKFNIEVAEKTSTLMLLLEIYANIIIIVLMAYLIDNVVNKIYLPSNLIYGYDKNTNNESFGYSYRIIFGFSLFFYQHNLRNRIEYLIKRIF
jgi:hypothetical protein